MVEWLRAIEARLKQVSMRGTAVPAFVGDPPDHAVPPYTFVWGPPSVPVSTDVADCGREVDQYLNVTCVAASTINAIALGQAVGDLLDRWAPQRSGWRTFPLVLDSATDVRTTTPTSPVPASNARAAWTVLRFHLRATKETK